MHSKPHALDGSQDPTLQPTCSSSWGPAANLGPAVSDKDFVLAHPDGLSCLLHITRPRWCQVAVSAIIESHLPRTEFQCITGGRLSRCHLEPIVAWPRSRTEQENVLSEPGPQSFVGPGHSHLSVTRSGSRYRPESVWSVEAPL